MIETFYFALGFIFYTAFTMLVFDVYSKKEGRTNYFALLGIFFFNSILMAYTINFVDYASPVIERIGQMVIYFLIASLYLYYYYSSKIKTQEDYDSAL